MMGRPWSPEDMATLVHMVDVLKTSCAEAGRRLGRNRSECARKYRKIKGKAPKAPSFSKGPQLIASAPAWRKCLYGEDGAACGKYFKSKSIHERFCKECRPKVARRSYSFDVRYG